MVLSSRRSSTASADAAALTCTCIQHLHDASAQLAVVIVDDRDRDLAQDLIELRLRVEDAVDQWRNPQQDESPGDRQHAPPFGCEGATDAARRRRGDR